MVNIHNYPEAAQAWSAFLELVEKQHKTHQQGTVVMEGSQMDAYYHAILLHVQGYDVVFAVDGDVTIKADESLNISPSLFESMDEIDLNFSQSQASQLPHNHPLIGLKHLKTLFTNPGGHIPNVEDLEKANRFVKEVFDVLKEQGFIKVYEDARIQDTSPQGKVTLEHGHENITLEATLVIQEKGQQLMVSHHEFPGIPEQSPPSQAAHREHKKMMQAAQYREHLESASKGFYSKPSIDADKLFNRTMAQRPNLLESDRLKVVVVGLGPTGLIAAIRAYQKGANVIALEQRNQYTRNNIFRLYPEIVDRLKKLFVESDLDIAQLAKNHPLRTFLDLQSIAGPRQSNDVEGKYYTMTTQDFELLCSTWLELMAVKDPQHCQVLKGWQYAPGSINAQNIQNGHVGIRPFDKSNSNKVFDPLTDRQIPADILIGADGYNSKIRQDCGIQTNIHSSSKSYATITYHSERQNNGVSQTNVAPRVRDGFEVQALRPFGWTSTKEPIVRYFTTGDHPYLGVEIPDVLFQEIKDLEKQAGLASTEQRYNDAYLLKSQRDAKIEDWCNLCMKLFHKQHDLQGLVKKQATAFQVQLQAATEPSFVRHDGLVVILAGDSLQSAHFQTWHGAVTGMNQAEDVGHFIDAVVTKKMPKQNALKTLAIDLKLKTLHLHERPFGFTQVNGDDFGMKQEAILSQFKTEVRCEAIKDNRNMGAALNQHEAAAKMTRRSRR